MATNARKNLPHFGWPGPIKFYEGLKRSGGDWSSVVARVLLYYGRVLACDEQSLHFFISSRRDGHPWATGIGRVFPSPAPDWLPCDSKYSLVLRHPFRDELRLHERWVEQLRGSLKSCPHRLYSFLNCLRHFLVARPLTFVQHQWAWRQ